jgi:hypothetical protein
MSGNREVCESQNKREEVQSEKWRKAEGKKEREARELEQLQKEQEWETITLQYRSEDGR